MVSRLKEDTYQTFISENSLVEELKYGWDIRLKLSMSVRVLDAKCDLRVSLDKG